MPKKITLNAETFDVPLGKLVLSPRNVRKTYAPEDIEDMAASIRAPGRGLLQNLGVTEQLDEAGEPTGSWEVVAGGRRLRALKLLAERKYLPANVPIPCRKVARDLAIDASLEENERRQALHPADAYEAYAALHKDGRGLGVEEIAARHNTTPHSVRQRLRLGTVAPALLDAYRAGALDLDHVMAFAVTEDREAQMRAFTELAEWQRTPAAIRRVLTQPHVPATDRRALLVGLDAYQAAGGRVQRDLFTEDGGGWLTDVALLERLVGERMQQAAERVAAEGWKWVSTDPPTPAECWRMRRVWPSRVALSEADEARREELAIRLEGLEAEHPHGFEDAPEEIAAEAASVEEELAALEAKQSAYDPGDVARAGATIALIHGGTLRIDRGYVRPEDEPRREPAAEAVEDDAAGTGSDDGTESGSGDAEAGRDVPGVTRFGTPAHPSSGARDEAVARRSVPEGVGREAAGGALSAVLQAELEAHRTLGLRAEIARQPELALRVAVHGLATAAFYNQWGAQWGGTVANFYASMASQVSYPALTDSPARRAAERAEAEQRDKLPEQHADLWPWLEGQDVPALLALLAVCVARKADAGGKDWTTEAGARTTQARAAAAAGLDMREWWGATRDSYFDRVTKAHILDAVREGAGAEAARRIDGMKKEGMAANAEAALAGKGWLPKLLRVPSGSGSQTETETEADAGPRTEQAEAATSAFAAAAE